jgi:hypothetical protein
MAGANCPNSYGAAADTRVQPDLGRAFYQVAILTNRGMQLSCRSVTLVGGIGPSIWTLYLFRPWAEEKA